MTLVDALDIAVTIVGIATIAALAYLLGDNAGYARARRIFLRPSSTNAIPADYPEFLARLDREEDRKS